LDIAAGGTEGGDDRNGLRRTRRRRERGYIPAMEDMVNDDSSDGGKGTQDGVRRKGNWGVRIDGDADSEFR